MKIRPPVAATTPSQDSRQQRVEDAITRARTEGTLEPIDGPPVGNLQDFPRFQIPMGEAFIIEGQVYYYEESFGRGRGGMSIDWFATHQCVAGISGPPGTGLRGSGFFPGC
jgi:hypothetical protein